MRRIVQAGSVLGACGLVLLGTGIAQAQTVPGESLLGAAVGADVGSVTGDLGSLTGMVSGVVCNNRLADFRYKSPVRKAPQPHPCINGPVRSGNSLHSGNFINRGNPNNSGNLSSHNGSTNSGNSAEGASSGSSNNVQRMLKLPF
ncbi:hypothetical protein ACFY12_10080 [Streptomyces sp. NPDC001339]|uniref:hypothetical protein n=1 Tax=Streptomyces sp. NPDC001339 TaxID=3364563 RepID=UPI003676BCA9